jgi:hypothetical protein|tara:strand:- start:199 stop:444 length:246 start_codon:yes stop_codon:yes gene_type:complete
MDNNCYFCERPSSKLFCSTGCEHEYDKALKEKAIWNAMDTLNDYIRHTLSTVPITIRDEISEKLRSLGHQDRQGDASKQLH